MRYCSIDIETTGLDPDKHDLLETGLIEFKQQKRKEIRS